MKPLLIRLPGGLSSDGLEVLVLDQEWGVEVDVRPAYSTQTWTPLQSVGGTFTEREQ